eukprot:1701337-Amphidinium_carterae.1
MMMLMMLMRTVDSEWRPRQTNIIMQLHVGFEIAGCGSDRALENMRAQNARNLVAEWHMSIASPTNATHSKLLDCNAKANSAAMLKPKLGKLAMCPVAFFTRKIPSLVSKSKKE